MTLKLAVVGLPVGHSRSPVIQEAALEAVGLRASYDLLEVDEDGMRRVVADVRSGDLDGVNVTMPYKGLAHDLCDRVSADASRARSVNTIVGEDGQVRGYSTDVTGLKDVWASQDLPNDRPILLLGNGGAAAAALIALERDEVYGSSRRDEGVSELVERTGCDVIGVPWGAGVAEAVVVNATPLGMREEPVPERVTEVWSGLVDMPYRSDDTPAVRKAKVDSVPYVDGLDLLVAQAAESFSLWTGLEAPVEVMRQAARRA